MYDFSIDNKQSYLVMSWACVSVLCFCYSVSVTTALYYVRHLDLEYTTWICQIPFD